MFPCERNVPTGIVPLFVVTGAVTVVVKVVLPYPMNSPFRPKYLPMKKVNPPPPPLKLRFLPAGRVGLKRRYEYTRKTSALGGGFGAGVCRARAAVPRSKNSPTKIVLVSFIRMSPNTFLDGC